MCKGRNGFLFSGCTILNILSRPVISAAASRLNAFDCNFREVAGLEPAIHAKGTGVNIHSGCLSLAAGLICSVDAAPAVRYLACS